ncbi:MAG: hypothetical protein KME45_03390 [Stenomitos rutilans HA7619-LM2]|jgi:hypothetical protein|nr:hypothetical protein [Stenomitos rutilans HA7619-LM2]MBW4469429.1 hypothetical protein [Stenomitos rutilans HA7619-LM2]
MVQINQIVIPCPPSIVTAYGSFGSLPGACDLFDSVNNWLQLSVQPNSYKKLSEGKIEVKDGFTSPFALSPTRRIGFEVTIADGRVEIEDILNTLMNTAIADPTTIQAITVLDYVRPETSDRYATGYTVRQGIFTEIAVEAGTLMFANSGFTGRRLSTGGLRVTFQEFTRRIQY